MSLSDFSEIMRLEKKMFTKQFVNFLRFVWKKLWIMVIVAAITTGAAYVVLSYFNVPKYTNTVTLLDSSNHQLAYPTVVNSTLISNSVLKKVKNNPKMPNDASKQIKKVTLSANSSTPVFAISVTSENAVVSKYVANQTAKVFVKKVPHIITGSVVKIVPGIATESSSLLDSWKTILMVSAVIGVVLSLLFVTLREYLFGKVANQTFPELLLDEKYLGDLHLKRKNEG